jgi:predicted phage terminase large subunit-like protein
VKVTALGVGQNIRGRRHRQERPDLIILDDVESQDNTATSDSRAKLHNWFGKAVLKAGTPHTNLVVIGTIQHYDALLARVTDPVKSPTWDGRVYRSIIRWSGHPELWQTWAQVLHGHEEYDGTAGREAAMAYFRANRAAMLEGTEVLWPQMEDYYTLMLMRESEGPASFDSEKQNEPVNPDDCFFLEEDFRFWDDRWESEQALIASLGQGAEFVGACDPSLGKQGKHADDSAIITLLRDGKGGTLYVLDADIRRRKPDNIIDEVLAYARIRKYARFGFETNQFQSFLADELKRRSAQAGIYLPVHDIQHTTDKLGRIQSLQPLVRSGTLQFSRRHTTLLEQLRLFPKAAHDDGPDALEMAVAVSREIKRGLRPGDVMLLPRPIFYTEPLGRQELCF